jgi:lactate dehydrogenase-like 2-hydroxyacid dehydrogenase
MPNELPRVFISLPLSDDQLAPLAGYELIRRTASGLVQREELLETLAGAVGHLGSAVVAIPNEVIDAAPKLRVISNFGVGFDNVDLAYARGRSIDVCNTPGVLSDAVADLTLGLILQLARGLGDAQAMVREKRWDTGAPPLPLGSDLKGKTLSIIGMGRIGLEVVRRALAFKMRIVCFDPRPDCQIPNDCKRASTLEDALREADFVSLHTNLTPESIHLIDAAALAAMKPTAYVVNTARGPIVEQRALYDALTEGRIAGAALDVLEVEPPPEDEPLLSLANVIITPHIGSATVETRDAMARLAVQNLVDCLEGRGCANVVNAEM